MGVGQSSSFVGQGVRIRIQNAVRVDRVDRGAARRRDGRICCTAVHLAVRDNNWVCGVAYTGIPPLHSQGSS